MPKNLTPDPETGKLMGIITQYMSSLGYASPKVMLREHNRQPSLVIIPGKGQGGIRSAYKPVRLDNFQHFQMDGQHAFQGMGRFTGNGTVVDQITDAATGATHFQNSPFNAFQRQVDALKGAIYAGATTKIPRVRSGRALPGFRRPSSRNITG